VEVRNLLKIVLEAEDSKPVLEVVPIYLRERLDLVIADWSAPSAVVSTSLSDVLIVQVWGSGTAANGATGLPRYPCYITLPTAFRSRHVYP